MASTLQASCLVAPTTASFSNSGRRALQAPRSVPRSVRLASNPSKVLRHAERVAVKVQVSPRAVLGLFQGTKTEAEAGTAGPVTEKELAARLGRSIVKTNQFEDIIAQDVVNPDHITVGFNDVGGLDAVKRALHELVVLPFQRPDIFRRSSLLRPVKGILLYGPPGTGKTMMAKAIAKESGAVFINVRVANLQSKWFGDANKLVTAVFTLAWKVQPAIIFIDEVDSFLGKRKTTEHEATNSMKTEFMALWDGFVTNENANVIVLCATNRPGDLDEAIIRRLPRAFEIGLPDAAQRERILRVLLRGERLEPNFDFAAVARATAGYSGSDLEELCRQAAYRAVRDLLETERAAAQLDMHTKGGRSRNREELGRPSDPRPLRVHDFLEELKRTSKEALGSYRGGASKRTGSYTDLAYAGLSAGEETAETTRANMSAMLQMMASIDASLRNGVRPPPAEGSSN